LEQLGHEAIAIDLPGHGTRRDERSTLADRRDAIVDVVRSGDVLVGHSGGGYDITVAAAEIPERVAFMIYLAAGLPLEGRTVLEATGGATTRNDTGEVEVLRLKSDETGMSSLVRRNERGRMECTDFDAVRAHFYHDCDDGTAKWAYSLLTPAPTEFLLEPVSIPRFWTADIPRSYILCSDDRAKSRAASDVVIRRLGVEPITVEGSHSPFLSRPRELAARFVQATTTRPVAQLQPD
jgi:pimeloyl-ACP methyl ester carboxylesterase